MRYAFACRKLSGTCHSKYTRAVSEPAAAPTWLPGNMLPLIGAPLVHFGQVPAGVVVGWVADPTGWQLPSHRGVAPSPPRPDGPAAPPGCWEGETAERGGGTRRKAGRAARPRGEAPPP